ncbi:MAG: CCA tRNA nucleotidyltransferase [Myxococcota bacterium]|nr:CCA tRNA nucleotidyltransferase [Myxococcota bacterium]
MQAPHLQSHSIPGPVRELCDQLAERGFRAWVVGGCIRDLLMGKEVADWDLATDATPDDMRRVFRRTVPTGIAHGTMTVLHRGGHYEVTTLRGEGAYTDGRRPDSVHFVSDIAEDLARRDFTVNAIAYDPREDAIVDPWSGMEDLRRRVVRAVRDPRERFAEDGLRVLRAARFVATLEFELDPDTEAAIPPTLETFRKVSPERVRDEWAKTLTKARRPSRAFEVMRRTGMLAISAPAVAALEDDAFARAMRRVDAAAKRLPLRIAALVLEVQAAEPELDAWMRAMRFSNDERATTLHLLRHRDVAGFESWSDLDVRRFLHRATRDHWSEIVALEHADRVARGLSIEPIETLGIAIDRALEARVPLVSSDLAISGKDVMSALGSGPGRHVGVILARLLARAIDDPALNDRDRLLALVPDVAKEIGS